MPIRTRFHLIIFSLVLVSCGGTESPDSEPASSEVAGAFSAFSQALYDELRETPVSDSVDVEIGLFGNLNVMAGESVVMGRYRYRVDSTDGTRIGHLAFLARSMDDSGAVPVVLAFEESDGSWSLREATYESGASDARTVERVLSDRLEAWVRRAAANTSS